MSPDDAMHRVNELTSHVWMVRTFLKHCDEAQEDAQLLEVPRDLYDFMLALGSTWNQRDAPGYLKMARKKFSKLKRASEQFAAMQPDISNHTNFQMAAQSLAAAVREIGVVLESQTP